MCCGSPLSGTSGGIEGAGQMTTQHKLLQLVPLRPERGYLYIDTVSGQLADAIGKNEG